MRRAAARPWEALFVRRLRLLGVLTAALLCGIVARLYRVQVAQHARLSRLALDQHLNTMQVPARRGDIVDRNHSAMAISLQVPSVFANPREILDPEAAARLLAPVLGGDAAGLRARLASDRFFVWLKRQAEPEVAARVAGLGLPGVGITKEPRRYYPNREAGAFIVGFAGLEARGLEGVEKTFDRMLLGATHKIAAMRDARGRALVADADADWARRSLGNTLELAIDLPLQHAAEAALAAQMDATGARAASAVVLGVADAEVLALAVVPGFNANLAAQTLAPVRRNRAITDLFEPGSTLKPLVVAAALESGAVAHDAIFDPAGGRLRIGRHTINDTSVHGELDLTGVLARSSNISMARIGQAMGRAPLYAALQAFNLTRRTGISLPGEAAGLLRPPSAWSDLDLATISFGQGVATNLVQLAAAYRVLAAAGEYRPPRLARRLVRPDGSVLPLPRAAARQVVAGEVAARVTGMLEASVAPATGTGRLARVAGYRVAGKTGTAQKADAVAGGYSKDRYLALFAGYLPAEAPRVVIVVAVDEPQSSHYGGVVAAPVFAQIGRVAMQRLGVPPSVLETASSSAAGAPAAVAAVAAAWAETAAADDAFVRLADEGEPARMPSCQGLTGRQALARIGRLPAGAARGLALRGSGRVVAQTPAAGQPLAPDDDLVLHLAP